jgi:hypothetical protein
VLDPNKPESPWSPPPPPKPAKPVVRPPLDRRQWGWLVLILVAVGAGVWAMTEFMPTGSAFDGDWPQTAQWLMLLVLIGSGVVRLRMRPHEAVRNIILWVVIAAALWLGYSVWTQLHAPRHGPPPVQVVPRPLGGPAQQVRAEDPLSREA